MSTTKTPPRQVPDWQRIELDFRAGTLTTREIASKHGISDPAISADSEANDAAAPIHSCPGSAC
jgi:hypothetical protein